MSSPRTTVQSFIHKIRHLAKADLSPHLQGPGNRDKTKAGSGFPAQSNSRGLGIVAIAASAGGPNAIRTILSHLPAAFPLPIVIAQHIAEGFTQGMAEWLNGGTPLTVAVANSGARLVPGRVYVNPAEHSMRITEQGMIILGDRDAGLIYHPSCNTLLSSVAAAYQNGALGLIMSGMGDDGVAGMQAINRGGGVTLAQDAKSSVVYGMNRLAVESGCIQKVVPLADIPALLMQRAGVKQ